MRDYLKRVLELVKPYRGRFAFGLLCGFLSGALAFSLPVSLTIALDTVFPPDRAGKSSSISATDSDSGKALPTKSADKNRDRLQFLPAPAKSILDGIGAWFRPPG